MTTRAFFPTLVYSARLRTAHLRALNNRLLRECRQLRRMMTPAAAGPRRIILAVTPLTTL